MARDSEHAKKSNESSGEHAESAVDEETTPDDARARQRRSTVEHLPTLTPEQREEAWVEFCVLVMERLIREKAEKEQATSSEEQNDEDSDSDQ